MCNPTEEQIKSFEEKDYQNASFLDFLAVRDALGVEIINDKFIASLDDFYLEHLTAMRQTENLKEEAKKLSGATMPDGNINE